MLCDILIYVYFYIRSCIKYHYLQMTFYAYD